MREWLLLRGLYNALCTLGGMIGSLLLSWLKEAVQSH